MGRAHSKNSRVFFYNGSIPIISSADAATDAAIRLADALSNPALAAPFARFGALTMDAIRQLAAKISANYQIASMFWYPKRVKGASGAGSERVLERHLAASVAASAEVI